MNNNTTDTRGGEFNRDIIARIATLVAYDCTDEEIVCRVDATPTAPVRWIAFMARAIREGRYVP